MKIVFYRTLLKGATNLTPSERILYSFLVAKSISRIEDIFEKDGTSINIDELEDCFNDYYGNHFPLCEISQTKIANELHMTRKTIFDGLRHLRNKGFIGIDWIFVNRELVEHGYFELINAECLTGELLIFYSFLLDKARKYNNVIDTNKYKLADIFDKRKDKGKNKKQPIAITKLLHRLYVKKLAERLKNGKLLIKHVENEKQQTINKS